MNRYPLCIAALVLLTACLVGCDLRNVATTRLQTCGAQIYPEQGWTSVYIDSTWTGTVDDFVCPQQLQPASLYISGIKLTTQHIELIAAIPQLRFVDLSGANVNDRELDLLKQTRVDLDIFDIHRRKRQLITFPDEELKHAPAGLFEEPGNDFGPDWRL